MSFQGDCITAHLPQPALRCQCAGEVGDEALVFDKTECDYQAHCRALRRTAAGTREERGFQMLKTRNSIYKYLIVLISAGLASCSSWSWNGTKVNGGNPLVRAEGETQFATVYFLRPLTERAMGFSDNPLTIALDDNKLLTLEKGDYTLVYLRPRVRTTMTVENVTEVGPDWRTKKMAKNYEFGFTAGETYFIVLEPVDGEFRGVYFTARDIDLFTAKQLAQQLRPTGEARKTPIGSL